MSYIRKIAPSVYSNGQNQSQNLPSWTPSMSSYTLIAQAKGALPTAAQKPSDAALKLLTKEEFLRNSDRLIVNTQSFESEVRGKVGGIKFSDFNEVDAFLERGHAQLTVNKKTPGHIFNEKRVLEENVVKGIFTKFEKFRKQVVAPRKDLKQSKMITMAQDFINLLFEGHQQIEYLKRLRYFHQKQVSGNLIVIGGEGTSLIGKEIAAIENLLYQSYKVVVPAIMKADPEGKNLETLLLVRLILITGQMNLEDALTKFEEQMGIYNAKKKKPKEIGERKKAVAPSAATYFKDNWFQKETSSPLAMRTETGPAPGQPANLNVDLNTLYGGAAPTQPPPAAASPALIFGPPASQTPPPASATPVAPAKPSAAPTAPAAVATTPAHPAVPAAPAKPASASATSATPAASAASNPPKPEVSRLLSLEEFLKQSRPKYLKFLSSEQTGNTFKDANAMDGFLSRNLLPEHLEVRNLKGVKKTVGQLVKESKQLGEAAVGYLFDKMKTPKIIEDPGNESKAILIGAEDFIALNIKSHKALDFFERLFALDQKTLAGVGTLTVTPEAKKLLQQKRAEIQEILYESYKNVVTALFLADFFAKKPDENLVKAYLVMETGIPYTKDALKKYLQLKEIPMTSQEEARLQKQINSSQLLNQVLKQWLKPETAPEPAVAAAAPVEPAPEPEAPELTAAPKPAASPTLPASAAATKPEAATSALAGGVVPPPAEPPSPPVLPDTIAKVLFLSKEEFLKRGRPEQIIPPNKFENVQALDTFLGKSLIHFVFKDPEEPGSGMIDNVDITVGQYLQMRKELSLSGLSAMAEMVGTGIPVPYPEKDSKKIFKGARDLVAFNSREPDRINFYERLLALDKKQIVKDGSIKISDRVKKALKEKIQMSQDKLYRSYTNVMTAIYIKDPRGRSQDRDLINARLVLVTGQSDPKTALQTYLREKRRSSLNRNQLAMDFKAKWQPMPAPVAAAKPAEFASLLDDLEAKPAAPAKAPAPVAAPQPKLAQPPVSKPASKPVVKAAPPAKAAPKAPPAKASQAKVAPAKTPPAKASPAKASPAKASPAKASPAKASQARVAPAKTPPAEARKILEWSGALGSVYGTAQQRTPPKIGGRATEEALQADAAAAANAQQNVTSSHSGGMTGAVLLQMNPFGLIGGLEAGYLGKYQEQAVASVEAQLGLGISLIKLFKPRSHFDITLRMLPWRGGYNNLLGSYFEQSLNQFGGCLRYQAWQGCLDYNRLGESQPVLGGEQNDALKTWRFSLGYFFNSK